ncbi:MAG: hypothetical protein O9272_13780 [Brevundimonas sp.]|jgi:hypothetical protein|nr:hypothetical protein [Brevundimonas sp.]
MSRLIAAPAPGPVFTPSERPYPFSSAVQVGNGLYRSGQLGARVEMECRAHKLQRR